MQRSTSGAAPTGGIRGGSSPLVDGLPPLGHLVTPVAPFARPHQLFFQRQAPPQMSKPRAFPTLTLFVVATGGRNMTRPAYVAVLSGVVMMVLLTVDPA